MRAHWVLPSLARGQHVLLIHLPLIHRLTAQLGAGGTRSADTGHQLPSSTVYGAETQPTSSRSALSLPVATSVLWSTDDTISNLDDSQHWHRSNRLLFDFFFPGHFGSSVYFILIVYATQGALANGTSAWEGLVEEYQDSARQRRRTLKTQLRQMIIPYRDLAFAT